MKYSQFMSLLSDYQSDVLGDEERTRVDQAIEAVQEVVEHTHESYHQCVYVAYMTLKYIAP